MRDLGLPPPKDAKHAQAQVSILMDATLEALWDDRALSYSRRKSWWAQPRRYLGGAYTYGRVVPFVDRLASDGLIEHWKAPAVPSGGRQSTLRATAALIADLAPVSFVYEVGETVRLRDADKNAKDYAETDWTLSCRRNLAAINEGLGSVTLALPGAESMPHGVRVATPRGGVVLRDHRNQVFRVFNNDFRHGGRMYGHDVQQLPKTWRRRLLIDGEHVAEPDYNYLHPQMLYALAGKRLVGDPYIVEGFDRSLCKMALNTLVNSHNHAQGLMAVAREIERRDRGDPDYGGWPTKGSRDQAGRLIEALKACHSEIAGSLHTGMGTRLQFLDSLMAERVLLALQRHGVVGLPVHDSFIVPERHNDLTRQTMAEAFDQVMQKAVA